MLRNWWYKLYVFALITIGIVVIVPSLVGKHTDTVTTLTSSVTALNFYSAAVPLESKTLVSNWLRLNDVSDTSLSNITVREGTLSDSTYRFDGRLLREVSFYMDSKTPKVSFVVTVESDPYQQIGSETTIGCPDESKQWGSAAKCTEMLAP